MLLLAAFIQVGTLGELWLVEHNQDPLQFVPFVLCGVGLIAVAAALFRPQRATLVALRIVMILVAIGGLVGVGVHLLENFAFQQEIRPTEAVGNLILPALKGGNPLLAPGTLVFTALLALAATYYHPALQEQEAL